MIHYELAENIGAEIKEIIRKLDMTHIDGSRSSVSGTEDQPAGGLWRGVTGCPESCSVPLILSPTTSLTIISEQFDKLDKANQTKVLIHELMHILHSFDGGFRSHRPYMTKRKVEKMYQQFLKAG